MTKLKLKPCPLCDSNALEEDWDGLSEGTYDTQVGFIDCKGCHFGISQIFSTEFVPDSCFTEELYKLWNSLVVKNK